MWSKSTHLTMAVIALVLSTMAWGNLNSDPSLVGWWPLDDGAGSTARDASGNGNDGTLEGGPTWATGWLQGALSFDGADDHVDCGNDPALNPTDSFSVSFWANISEWTTAWGESFLGKGGDNDRGGWSIRRGSGESLNFTIAGLDSGHNMFGNATPVLNEWIHITCVYDKAGGTALIYIDGALDASITATGDGEPTDEPLYLGTRGDVGGGPDTWAPANYGGMLDDVRFYSRVLTPEEIQEVITGGGDPALASGPSPVNDDTDIIRDQLVLSWLPGQYAAAHDVYLGTSLTNVNDASRDNPGNVLVSQGQTDTSYALGRLELGQTYFWRIDEVNAAPDSSIHKGEVWSFTIEPVSYALAGSSITATASSVRGGDPNTTTTGPEKTIDGSGLDDNDGHSTAVSDMWLSNSPDATPWIQYELDGVYKLDRMLLWNSNQSAETAVGWGLKDVTIETSLDGADWTAVDGVTQLTQASGNQGVGPTDDLDLGGTAAKFVRINITSNWGGIVTQYCLSEVRFYYIPVQAREPEPVSGATGVLPDAVLNWRAGREAGSHDVFVDTDANAVLDGSAPSQTVADNSFDLSSLDLPIGETYYWKVNEVNEAEDPPVWSSPVWGFSVPDPLVVDDFESYGTTNIAMRPYVTWRDGLDFSNPAPGGTGNGTGAIVGHDIFSPGSPFFDGDLMELSLIHGGSQSLPLYYDNSGNNGNEPYSEMTRTFSPAQDWSGNAIATLTLYFRGMEGNAGQLYVKINDTKVVFDDDPGAISRPMWEQWNIDLSPQGQASTGANLSNVQSLTIGIEEAGSGLVYIDDIVLYRNAPAVAQGIDPGNAGLVASYSMENNVNDDTGNYNGTATGNPLYETGYSGMALTFDGIEDYVDLPIGSVISSQPDMTVTGWVKFAANGGAWQRIFDFGSGTTNYMFLTPSENVSGPIRFAILTPDIEGESQANGLVALPAGDWHHVAVAIDSGTMTNTLYVDGSVVASSPTEALPQDLGETTQNWLGRSQWEADAFFEGSLDEFLIYDRALSEAEIRYLAGER